MNWNIAFVTGGLEFSGDSLDKHSLGGSESAMLLLSRELALRGHRVTVFCNCLREGVFSNVTYYDRSRFDEFLDRQFDILVVSRWFEYLTAPIRCGLRVLWSHDIPDPEKDRLLGSLYQTDLIAVLSEYHKQIYLDLCPELEKLIWVTKNGVDQDGIRESVTEYHKDPNALVYTSRPERGLLYLLRDIWPKLVERRPELKLYYCTYESTNIPSDVQELTKYINTLAKQYNNVFNMGNLTKRELYRAIARARALVYSCSFPEISCLSVLEAQACGTPVVTTNDWALKESAKVGRLIDDNPGDESYTEEFVKQTIYLLDSPFYNEICARGIDFIQRKGYTWRQIAGEWESFFKERLQARWETEKLNIIKQLIYQGDAVHAYELSQEEPKCDVIRHSELEKIEILNKSVLPASSARERFLKRANFYKVIAQEMLKVGIRPRSLIDLFSGDVPFGLAFKKLLPSCDVSLFDERKEVCERVNSFADKSELDIRMFLGHLDDERVEEIFGTYDVVFLQNVIENRLDWEEILQTSMHLVSEGGYLVILTEDRKLGQKLSKWDYNLFNFQVQDFADLFKSYSLSYLRNVEEGTNHYLVCIRRQESIKTIDLGRRKLFTRPYQSIGLLMITKDEADNVRRSLRRVIPYMDDAVVGDSGSQDNTKRIAIDCGARLVNIEFGDFGQAKNTILSHLETDWVLVLDADEVLINPENLREYLQGPFYEGFNLKQVHLTLDLKKTYDTPVRLFRRRQEYKFVGCIHEHIEDTSRGVDSQLKPTLLISDIEIAHYGYETESMRRAKCSSRNINLLIKDLTENSERQLNKILVQRDFLNIAKWRTGANNFIIEKDSIEHKLISSSVTIFLQYFKDEKHQYYKISYPMYQEALLLLARSNLPTLGRNTPPVQVEFLLRAAIGGLSEDNYEPIKMWFVDDTALIKHIEKTSRRLVNDLGFDEVVDGFETIEIQDMIEFLKYGLNVY